MQNLLKNLKEYWIIIGFLAGMIMWYADTNSRLSTVEAKQKEQETALEIVAQMQIDVAVIKTNVDFIKGRLD